MSLESLFLTCLSDAIEGRHVITCDIPGAFMQTNIDELIHVKLEGDLVDLLIRVDPTYAKYVVYEGKNKVIYAELNKALYGTMQASYLFWKDLSKYLIETLGFIRNPYDWCVVNKQINGHQCTICWYVDDVKMSHVNTEVLEDVLSQLQDRFGKEAPLTITRGNIHTYLGMELDYSKPGKVTFRMDDFIKEILEEAPEDLMT